MIRNIWAVGRNYADHAKELGNAVPSSPLIFLKAGSSACHGPKFSLPDWATDIHHEIELALRFDARLEFDAFALALDLTERKIQNELKSKGQPWTLAKSFTGSCPLSPWNKIGDHGLDLKTLQTCQISLAVNNEVRQQGNTSQMIFAVEHLREFVLKHFPVCAGDVLLTGTPAGVGPLVKGDQFEAKLGDIIWTGSF